MPEIRIGGLGVADYAPGTVVNVTAEEAAEFVNSGVASYVNEQDAVAAPAVEVPAEEAAPAPSEDAPPPPAEGSEGDSQA